MPSSLFLERHRRFPHFLVTFDGGARLRGRRRVAGAAAVLWGPICGDGDRRPLKFSQVMLPGVEHAQVAEAWGLRLACLLLLGARASFGGEKSALIAGDNLAVVRYGAAQGRLHRPEMQGILEQVLGQLAAAGWSPEWVAMRRAFNKAADELATGALFEAGDLAKAGAFSPVFRDFS